MEQPDQKKEEPKGSPGYVRFIKDNSLILFIFYLLNRVDGLEKDKKALEDKYQRKTEQEQDAHRRLTRRLIDKGLGNDIVYRDSMDTGLYSAPPAIDSNGTDDSKRLHP